MTKSQQIAETAAAEMRRHGGTATVLKTEDGYRIEYRDPATGETFRRKLAAIMAYACALHGAELPTQLI